MDIKAFREALCHALKTTLDEKFSIAIRDVPKANEGVRYAIYIRHERSNSAPCIYLEEYFEKYQEGRPIKELADSILSIIKGSITKSENGDFRWLSDWELAKDHLLLRLVNPAGNDDLLEDSPAVPFLNLCCVFYVKVFHVGQVRVSNDLMAIWKQTPESLFFQAVKNMDRVGMKLSQLWDVVKDFFPAESTSAIDGISSSPIYMLTDAGMSTYGASVIVSEKIRRDICQRFHHDMYVLPSSVHELLFVPADNKASPYELLRLVREVNQSAVHKSDWLADNVYLLRSSDAGIVIAA